MKRKPASADKPNLLIAGQLPDRIARQLVKHWVEEIETNDWELPVENYYLGRFVHIAGEHVAQKHFGVNAILEEMKTSRTSLHRKLKAATGHSALELIRMIKMQKALLLLQTTRLSIAEVTLQVGFSSPSHFTKIFSLYFGYLPSQVKDQSVKSNLPHEDI